MPPTPRGRRKPPRAAGRARQTRWSAGGRTWVFVALGIILLVSWIRAKHLGFPLERDEGEFGYIAQQLLRGVPVYDSAYTQKLPGTYFLYALFLVLFGQCTSAIHFGLLLTNAVIMGLIFLVLRKTHNGLAGCVGALVFGVMALSPKAVGFAAHATFFITLFAVAGLYAFLIARDRNRAVLFFVSGLCFGLAFLMKQSGIFFAPFAMALLAVDHLRRKPREPARFALAELALVGGALTPIVLTASYYAFIGKFSLFWFWAFQLAGEFAGQVGPAAALKNLHDRIKDVTMGFELLWALGLVGFVWTMLDAKLGKDRYLYSMFAVACVLSVVPGFFFTNHYFIPALGAIALLIGALAARVNRQEGQSGPRLAAVGVWTLIGLGLVIGIGRFGGYYFGQTPDSETSHWVYGANPFPETVPIGDYLRNHTMPQDRIAMLGSETQILFYAQRRSASRFVNAYFLTANHPRNREMQREMIRDIERERPKYIVFARFPMSWAMLKNSPRDLLSWFAEYGREHYELEGILLMGKSGYVLKWGSDARSQATTSDNVEILRRLDSSNAPSF